MARLLVLLAGFSPTDSSGVSPGCCSAGASGPLPVFFSAFFSVFLPAFFSAFSVFLPVLLAAFLSEAFSADFLALDLAGPSSPVEA